MIKYLFFRLEGWKTLVYVFVFYFIFQFILFLILEKFFPSLYYAYEGSYFDIITNSDDSLKDLFLNDSVLNFVKNINPDYAIYLENVIKYDLYSIENSFSVIIAASIHLLQTFFYCWWIILIWKNTNESNILNGFIRFMAVNIIFYVIMHLVFSIYTYNAGFSFKEVVVKTEILENNYFEDVDSKIFKNKDISFFYPSDWNFVSNDKVLFKAISKDENAKIVIVEIEKDKEEQEKVLDIDYIKFLLKSINKILDITNEGEIDKNGYKGYFVEYISEVKNGKTKVLNVRFLKENKVFIIEFITYIDDYEKYQENFFKIFESIKLK